MNENKNDIDNKYVIEFYNVCEKAMYSSMKEMLDEMIFTKKTLDIGIRKCIRKSERNRKDYYDCINLLLQECNVNFKNPQEEDSTLLMIACAKGDLNIIELIVDNNYTGESQQIDFKAEDKNQRNFLHYLMNENNNEDDVWDILSCFSKTCCARPNQLVIEEAIPEIIQIESEEKEKGDTICDHNEDVAPVRQVLIKPRASFNLTEQMNIEDKDGVTLLAVALVKGWFKIANKLIKLKANPNHIIKSNLNNMLHCAVISKNLNCINLILNFSTKADIRHKNKEGQDPIALAIKLKFHYYAKVIENYEDNLNNPMFLNFIKAHVKVRSNDILEKFTSEEYKETLFLLNQFKINQSIICENSRPVSVDWNIFLTEHIRRLKRKYEIQPERVLSKFLDDIGAMSKIKKFNSFFSRMFQDLDYNKVEDDSNPLDVLIFNKITFQLITGNFASSLGDILNYLKYILPHNDTMYYKWIVYVNITFILIEGLVTMKFSHLAKSIIERLEEFLFTNFNLKKDDVFTIDQIPIVNYLDTNEIINKFSSSWDESFCYVNLLKAMKNIYEGKLDDAKNNMKLFKKLYNNSSYREELKIFKRLHNVYTTIKLQMFYYQNTFPKCYKNLNKIYKVTKTEQVNIIINNVKFDETFNVNEYVLYYNNTLGIIFLKQKKFQLAEFYFKTAIEYFKNIFSELKMSFDFSIKLQDLVKIKYNLGLCYFYQRNYSKALDIFRELTKSRMVSTNVFLWYRLGLCELEMFMTEVHQLKVLPSQNEVVYRTIHLNEKLESKTNEDVDDLMTKFEQEYSGKGKLEPIRLIRFIMHSYPPLYRSEKSKHYLINAIYSFKQALILTKSNINCNSTLNRHNYLKSIYDFYYDKKAAYTDSNYNDQQFEEYSPQIKSFNAVLVSIYLNLIFSLTLCDRWPEVIYYCNEADKCEVINSKKEKDIIFKIDNYKIEAYINLNLIDKAMELIKLNVNLITGNDFLKGSFYNKHNCAVYSEISFKVSLLVNMMKIHLANNNIEEAEKCIGSIMTSLNLTMNGEIPSYVLNLLIYLNLMKGNNKMALQLTQHRKLTNKTPKI